MALRRKGRLKKRYKYGVSLLISFIIISVGLYYIQDSLIFRPTKLNQEYVYKFDHDFEEVFLKPSDNAILNGLLFKNKSPKGVILYFHGNKGDLSRWGKITEHLVDLNYDVLVVDYRTYGKSSGALSEKSLYDDAQYCYNYLLKNYSESEIVIYGRSLGTGIATYLASRNSPKKLLLETPYYSLIDVAQFRFPLFPVAKLLKYKIPSYKFIQTVKCPINIIHGTSDIVVPLTSGEKLFRIAPKGQSTMTIVKGGGHNNLKAFDEYKDWIYSVLE